MGVKRDKTKAETAKQVLEYVDTCAYCGRTGTPYLGPDRQGWHIDHVYPRAKDGFDGLENMVKACATCNQAKDINLWRPRAGTVTAAGTLAEDERLTYAPLGRHLVNIDELKAQFPPSSRGGKRTTYQTRQKERLAKAKQAAKPKVDVEVAPLRPHLHKQYKAPKNQNPRAKKKQWQQTHRHVHHGNVKLDERVGTYAWIYTSRKSKRVIVRFQDLTPLHQTTYMKTPVSYVHKNPEAPAKPIVDYREAGTYQVINPRAK